MLEQFTIAKLHSGNSFTKMLKQTGTLTKTCVTNINLYEIKR
jgi:hypothetical protein